MPKENNKSESSFESLAKSIKLYILARLMIYKFKYFVKLTLPYFSISCFLSTILVYKLLAPTSLFLHSSILLNLVLISIYFLFEICLYTLAYSTKDVFIAKIKKYSFELGNALNDTIELIGYMDEQVEDVDADIKRHSDVMKNADIIANLTEEKFICTLNDNNTEHKN